MSTQAANKVETDVQPTFKLESPYALLKKFIESIPSRLLLDFDNGEFIIYSNEYFCLVNYGLFGRTYVLAVIAIPPSGLASDLLNQPPLAGPVFVDIETPIGPGEIRIELIAKIAWPATD